MSCIKALPLAGTPQSLGTARSKDGRPKPCLGLLLAASFVLGGCVSYRLDAVDLLETNAQVAARGDVISPGRPIRAASLSRPFSVTEESVSTSFGPVALTRVESDPHQPLIVFCGGSAFRQDVRGAVTVEQLGRFGDVWTFDYPGYGRSEGKGEPGDFDALVPALARRIDAAYADGRTQGLVLWGHSFGGGVCARLAAAVRTPSSLVLVGAFENYGAVVKARAQRLAGPLGLLVRPVIAPDVPNTDIVETLSRYDGGIVVLASRTDEVVPFSASAKLERSLRAAGKRTRLVLFPSGDHVRFYEAPGFEARVREALASLGLGGRAQAPASPRPRGLASRPRADLARPEARAFRPD